MAAALSPVCASHEHGDGLPDPELRNHVLAQAIRVVEDELRQHGYDDPERSAEILHVAIEDALAIADEAEAPTDRITDGD